MAKLIAAMASSHAYKFLEPSVWDKRRFGVEPADQPQVTEETLEANEARYQKIYDGLSFVRQRVPDSQPNGNDWRSQAGDNRLGAVDRRLLGVAVGYWNLANG